jgi:hypothetical protein
MGFTAHDGGDMNILPHHMFPSSGFFRAAGRIHADMHYSEPKTLFQNKSDYKQGKVTI